jgi:large subunit ribosomal protein L15
LAKVTGDEISIESLKDADLLRNDMLRARIFLDGTIDRAVTVKGLAVSKGARAAIEQAGGKVED